MSTINKRKKHFIPNFEAVSVVLVAALALGAAVAHAQSTAPPMTAAPTSSAKDIDAAFVKADVNKDGKLDKAEAQTMPVVAERFDKLDANADGFLSREEFAKAAGS